MFFNKLLEILTLFLFDKTLEKTQLKIIYPRNLFQNDLGAKFAEEQRRSFHKNLVF